MGKEGKPAYTPEDVFRVVRDCFGHSLVRYIQEALRDNPHIRRIVIIGLPGSGKTTILIGLRGVIIKEYPKLIKSTKTVFFDPIRKEYIQAMETKGISAKSIPDLPKDDQEYFGEFLSYAFYDATNVDPESELIFLEEFPARGVHDRGQEALKRMAEGNARAFKKHRKVETFVISLIGDPKVVLKAKKVREAAAQCKNDYELLITLKELGVYLRDEVEDDKDSTTLLTMYLSEASPHQIDMINKEEQELMDAIYAQALADPKSYWIHLLPQMMQIPPGITMDSPEDWELIAKTYLYEVQKLLAMGFLPESFFIGFNQMMGDIRY